MLEVRLQSKDMIFTALGLIGITLLTFSFTQQYNNYLIKLINGNS